jgi:hypothetical protein
MEWHTMITIISKVKSAPYPTKEKDFFADHVGPTRGQCPTSTHKKQVHVAHALTRQTITTTFSNKQVTTTFLDHCVCQFCGHVWEQEWMGAF